ncbi:unnamed protein product [Rotaria socialis]
MDRLLTHVRSRASIFLFPTRQISSYNTNFIDLKSRALINLVDQLDASKQNSSIPASNIDAIYELNSRFPLPGRIGFFYETNVISKPVQEQELLNSPNMLSAGSAAKSQEEILSKLMNSNNVEIRTYDCPTSISSKLNNLFLNYDVLNQPLTAITVAFKTKSDMSKWSVEVENERNQLIAQFNKLAQEISTYLNKKQYWVDFIDPSNGKPYYGPSTSDALFETDERYRNFGINVVDLGCCRVIEHLQHVIPYYWKTIISTTSKASPSAPHMYPESTDNIRPVPPVRVEFQGNPQEEQLLPPVPRRMDKQEENDTNIPNQECACNYNQYATKKTIGHGLLGFALLTSNAMQLRTLASQKQRDVIWAASVLLVCISIIVQIILAYLLVIVGKGNIQDPQKQLKLEKYNNMALFLTTLVSMVNVVINVFMSTTDSTSYLDTKSLELIRNST